LLLPNRQRPSVHFGSWELKLLLNDYVHYVNNYSSLLKKLRFSPRFFTKLLFPSDTNIYRTNPPTVTHCNYISAVTYARLYSIPFWTSAEKRPLARFLCIEWLSPCPAGHIAYRAVTERIMVCGTKQRPCLQI